MTIKIDNKLQLVPIGMDYAEDIFKAFDRDIIKYLPLEDPPQKIEDTKAFIRHSMREMDKGNDFVWVILNEKQFAGCCGIHTVSSRQPHFGLWIAKSQQRKGIGRKLVNYMLPWGIANLDVEFIKYPVDKDNYRSIELIQKLNLELSDHYEMGNQKKLNILEYRLYKK